MRPPSALADLAPNPNLVTEKKTFLGKVHRTNHQKPPNHQNYQAKPDPKNDIVAEKVS